MRHTVDEIKLSNGAKGLLVHIPGATVMTMDISFRAGEYLVQEDKWEVPHLMEHVLLGANQLIPKARDFQAEIEKNGAYSNATTGVYDITYEAESADFEWDRVLGLLLIAISKPLFLKEEYAAEFGNVQEEMVARSNNHFRRLSLEMRQAMGLFAKTDMERLELMKNVRLSDVKAHYERTHFARNMRFVFAGNFTKHRRKQVAEMLANIELPEGEKRFLLPTERPKRLRQPVYVTNDTVENLYFYIDTFLSRRLQECETDALSLANTILTETLYSRILGTAREQGLVYGMSSGLSYTKGFSNWWFGTQVSDKNAPALLDITVRELNKLRGGKIAKAEISAAKQYVLGRYQRSGQTVGATAGAYAGRYFFDGKIERYNQFPERVRAINRESIVAAADDMFSDNIWGFGVLGNCGDQFVSELNNQIASLWPAQPGN